MAQVKIDLEYIVKYELYVKVKVCPSFGPQDSRGTLSGCYCCSVTRSQTEDDKMPCEKHLDLLLSLVDIS